MTRYDLAVFDFDGTLADSADWFFGSLNEVAERFGFRTTTEEERQALRCFDNREIIRRLQVPMWKLPAIARHMRRRAAENIDSIRLFRGVPEALGALRKNGTRLAIVSSNSEQNVRRIMGGELADQIAFYGCGASLFGKTSQLRSAIKRCNIGDRSIWAKPSSSASTERRGPSPRTPARCPVQRLAHGFRVACDDGQISARGLIGLDAPLLQSRKFPIGM